jgi:ribonucleoside-diphosphate reductase alpha chain
MITVIKRNGAATDLQPEKIHNALLRAYVEVEGESARFSQRIDCQIKAIVQQIQEQSRNLESVHVEAIQDMVEKGLMAAGEHQVARAYILYRDEHARLRAAEAGLPKISYKDEEGNRQPITLKLLTQYLREACRGLKTVKGELIAKEAIRNLYDGASWREVKQTLLITTRTLIENEPDYSFVAARLVLQDLKSESRTKLGIGARAGYADDLVRALEHGVTIEQLDERLLDGRFDLKKLGEALIEARDLQFQYLGIRPYTTAIFSMTARCVMSAHKSFSCASPWALPCSNNSRQIVQSNSTSCSARLILCPQRPRCSTQARVALSCRLVT